MLAANVAFLAIQGVVVVPQSGTGTGTGTGNSGIGIGTGGGTGTGTGNGNGWIIASPAQIASSISLVYSIGSIISGLLLVRRNRTIAMQDANTAVRLSFPLLCIARFHYLVDFQCSYLHGMTKRFVYLEPLAIIFSLTYALLMWSCVVSSLIPRSADDVDDPSVQRLRVFRCAITVLLPENEEGDLYLRGNCCWCRHCSYILVHHQFMGLG